MSSEDVRHTGPSPCKNSVYYLQRIWSETANAFRQKLKSSVSSLYLHFGRSWRIIICWIQNAKLQLEATSRYRKKRLSERNFRRSFPANKQLFLWSARARRARLWCSSRSCIFCRRISGLFLRFLRILLILNVKIILEGGSLRTWSRSGRFSVAVVNLYVVDSDDGISSRAALSFDRNADFRVLFDLRLFNKLSQVLNFIFTCFFFLDAPARPALNPIMRSSSSKCLLSMKLIGSVVVQIPGSPSASIRSQIVLSAFVLSFRM